MKQAMLLLLLLLAVCEEVGPQKENSRRMRIATLFAVVLQGGSCHWHDRLLNKWLVFRF